MCDSTQTVISRTVPVGVVWTLHLCWEGKEQTRSKRFHRWAGPPSRWSPFYHNGGTIAVKISPFHFIGDSGKDEIEVSRCLPVPVYKSLSV